MAERRSNPVWEGLEERDALVTAKRKKRREEEHFLRL